MSFELTFVRAIEVSIIPSGLTYGGGFLYMGSFSFDDSIYRMNIATGGLTALSAVPEGGRADDLTYHNGQIWWLDGGDVRIFNIAAGTWSDVFELAPVFSFNLMTAIAHDGTNVWSLDWNHETLNRYRPSDMVELQDFDISGTFLGGQLPAVATVIDGNFWWATIENEIKIQNVASKALVGSVPDPLRVQIAPNASANAIASDGEFVWLIDNNTATTTVFEYRLPVELTTLRITSSGFRFPYQRWT